MQGSIPSEVDWCFFSFKTRAGKIYPFHIALLSLETVNSFICSESLAWCRYIAPSTEGLKKCASGLQAVYQQRQRTSTLGNYFDLHISTCTKRFFDVQGNVVRATRSHRAWLPIQQRQEHSRFLPCPKETTKDRTYSHRQTWRSLKLL